MNPSISQNTAPSPALPHEAKDILDLANHHYENFPVAQWLCQDVRPAIQAIYAFARTADDFADETCYAGQRLECLAHWRELLEQAAKGRAHHAVFKALAQAIVHYDLPLNYLHDLLSAFEYDVTHSRHADFESLLRYSTQSANPVGRLLLWVHGYRDGKLWPFSDAVCTALQLTNFWQDLAVDLVKDRIYIPQAYLSKFQVSENDLQQGRCSASYQQMMTELATQTQALFDQGRTVCDQVSGRLRWQLRLTWSGGQRILRQLYNCQFDVWRARPQLQRCDKLVLLWQTLSWRRQGTPC